ncbi:DEAD/DEAH box helicase [Lacibacterium aquatile]|uniref:DEAD/DEAH box helicase n=1 Tax=Lacibacterium aquatile TaxID=1168082 RepID=A0ABW5DP62_9PROT
MVGDTARPFMKYRIDQLEALFEKSQGDVDAMRALNKELEARNTDRAGRLHAKVRESMAATPRAPLFSAESPAETKPSMPPKRVTPSASTQQPPPREASASAGSQILDLGPLPTFRPPEGANEPGAIIAAWTALEALSPQTYKQPKDLAAGDASCVAKLTAELPWVKGEKSRPKKQLYYQIVLGSVPMVKATSALVKAFGEDADFNAREKENAAIAALLVDKNGFLLEEKAVGVSSFAWALPLALQLKLGTLGAWPQIETRIIGKLETMVRRFDEDDKPLPVDMQTILEAFNWLVAQFGLARDMVEPPSFAIRIYHYFKAKNPPEVQLLNSFYLGDLGRSAALVGQGNVPPGLRRYLGIEKPKQTFDLLAEDAALEAAVAPSMIPLARWPSPGGHPLVLLQQAAVNLARAELAGKEGIIAVNGPPGTGKTTLLRDVVASSVLDRALAMAAFDDPEKAFTFSGEKASVGDWPYLMYSLAPSLKGHEVLVASSNNKAVENISRELPAAKAVGREADELTYFKFISDCVHSPEETSEEEDEEAVDIEPVDTWGLVAAVLGNAKNRFAFTQRFWWDEDFAFRLYLKAVKGESIVKEIKDPETGKIERRMPRLLELEKPPLPQQTGTNWRKAQARLLSLKKEVERELTDLEAVRKLCFELIEAQHALKAGEAILAELTAQLPAVEAEAQRCQRALQAAEAERGRRGAEAQQHRNARPGFFAKLFRTQRWKIWLYESVPLVDAEKTAITRLRQADQASAVATSKLNSFNAKVRDAENALMAPRQKVDRLTLEVDSHRAVLGSLMVDEVFFQQGHEAKNLSAPWLPDSLHRKREELFIAAMAVHKAFIDETAQKVLHNLNVLMEFFTNGVPTDEAKRKLLGDLWSTLFMVIPVLSTTFASVDRMLGDLPAGSIGWLLVDEAGQATPQAAVGAIMRAKRTIVVGDPLQIPPVISLPERLNSEISKFFMVEKSVWSAPEASTQTLADRASRFQASFRTDRGPRRVGVPLLVHRRCQDPMFGISNRIAYDGQMVHAAGKPKLGPVGQVLGPTTWFDVDDEADTKWCPAEGEMVVELFKKLGAEGLQNPDLFVITPFRIVAKGLKDRLKLERQLFKSMGIDIEKWTQDRIGTIHTVQGREAEAVILVLGAPMKTQTGARNWAAGTPNILNVAVSRAKQHLYVVGSYGAWAGLGHAREFGVIPRRRTGPGAF